MKRNCDNCKKIYDAPPYNLRRGWGLCCSQICAAEKRERLKKDPRRHYAGRLFFKVKMILSDGSERWAMVNNRIAILHSGHANIYYKFIGKYGFGTNESNDLIFGEIFYLRHFRYKNIRPIVGVELIETN